MLRSPLKYLVFEQFILDPLGFWKWRVILCVMENCSTVAGDEVQLPVWPKEPPGDVQKPKANTINDRCYCCLF